MFLFTQISVNPSRSAPLSKTVYVLHKGATAGTRVVREYEGASLHNATCHARGKLVLLCISACRILPPVTESNGLSGQRSADTGGRGAWYPSLYVLGRLFLGVFSGEGAEPPSTLSPVSVLWDFLGLDEGGSVTSPLLFFPRASVSSSAPGLRCGPRR